MVILPVLFRSFENEKGCSGKKTHFFEKNRKKSDLGIKNVAIVRKILLD